MSASAFNVPRHHSILHRDNVEKNPIPQDPGFSEELYHRLYSESPNELPAVAGNATRKRMHALVDELPEFDVLKTLTRRDPMWAGMAAATLGAKVAPCVPKTANVKKCEDILAGLEMMSEENPENAKIADAIVKAQTALETAVDLDATQAAKLDESAIRHNLRAAIGQATGEIQEAEMALAMLGYGSGQGGSSAPVNPGVAIELAKRVKASPTLSAIIALAGKLTRTARAKRAARSEYARSEVVGVEQTSQVDRLLGSEMALLNDPDMSNDLLIRLTEKRALGFKMSGKDKLAKGPIVLMLDQSGSMCEDSKDVWAKAITLAIYDAARSDNRGFSVVLYNDGVIANRAITSPADMLDILASGPDGGTSYDQAMQISLAMASTKSDIILISDGDAPTEMAATCMAKANAMHTRIFGIGIGSYIGTALAAWSHESTKITDVSKDTQAMDLLFGEGGL